MLSTEGIDNGSVWRPLLLIFRMFPKNRQLFIVSGFNLVIILSNDTLFYHTIYLVGVFRSERVWVNLDVQKRCKFFQQIIIIYIFLLHGKNFFLHICGRFYLIILYRFVIRYQSLPHVDINLPTLEGLMPEDVTNNKSIIQLINQARSQMIVRLLSPFIHYYRFFNLFWHLHYALLVRLQLNLLLHWLVVAIKSSACHFPMKDSVVMVMIAIC